VKKKSENRPQVRVDNEVQRLAMGLIDSESTMTLATTGGAGAWAAPVYYVFYNQGFYFFSNPKSRHILDALSSSKSAAAIHVSSDKWQDIRGIQMSGKIENVPIGREAANALRKYLGKFPFCSEFFSLGQPLKLEDFIGKFKVELYKFHPDSTYYSDNGISFGFRESIDLPPGE
jgi:uncharacterized protein YhbP (UPF0306 family)